MISITAPVAWKLLSGSVSTCRRWPRIVQQSMAANKRDGSQIPTNSDDVFFHRKFGMTWQKLYFAQTLINHPAVRCRVWVLVHGDNPLIWLQHLFVSQLKSEAASSYCHWFSHLFCVLTTQTLKLLTPPEAGLWLSNPTSYLVKQQK